MGKAKVTGQIIDRAEVGKPGEFDAQICHKNVNPLLGMISLAKLRPEQISQAYATALATGRRDGEGGLSPRTVRQMHAIVKSALGQAVKWEILPRNPAAVVKGPKVGSAAMQTYDLDQTAELLEAARGSTGICAGHARSLMRYEFAPLLRCKISPEIAITKCPPWVKSRHDAVATTMGFSVVDGLPMAPRRWRSSVEACLLATRSIHFANSKRGCNR